MDYILLVQNTIYKDVKVCRSLKMLTALNSLITESSQPLLYPLNPRDLR